MVKNWCIASMLMAGFVTISSAQSPGPMGQGHSMMQDSSKTGGCGMMMAMTMIREVLQTKDGLIVVAGNRILKYDNNLKLLAEAKVEPDSTQMKAMQQMCPQRSEL